MENDVEQLRKTAAEYGQDHVFRFWDQLTGDGRKQLLDQVASIDFAFMEKLIAHWVRHEPPQETFDRIEPIPVIPPKEQGPNANEAWEAGEAAFRAGRVGILVVAGGQGTRLGFEGPKGSYPIGPVTGKTLFAYHAEKIRAAEKHYGCTLPWYLMVSNTNEEATRAFFKSNDFFGLNPKNVRFFKQRMVPCVDVEGKFMLDAPDRLAMNPNGHGGSIPALVDNGITQDARERGIDTLNYFQVDNWAINLADPYFIGYHVLANGEMSSKVHRKEAVREAVGVHCLCDGEYRVVEYSELDIYPQLLETDAEGNIKHFAGNPAIHILNTDFVERIASKFDEFPWHRAHKKIPRLDTAGNLIEPDEPNGYKFETFIFDALRYIKHEPVALELRRLGEYTPIKSYDGPNSVVRARQQQAQYWAQWLEAAGCAVPRDKNGEVTIAIEISPLFADSQDEFVDKAAGQQWPTGTDLAIGPNGEVKHNGHS
ncbi:MAG: UTP--glucose-1-phosphate uridylyltransferase [Candidatus Hydrogenedentota bacterium]